MPLVDDRGRLFGRINLIDGAVLAFVLLAIPLSYGAYLLFRAKPAEITAVEPSSIPANTEVRVRLSGLNFQPYLVPLIGTTTSQFLLLSPTQAEVVVPRMPPGTYDLTLYNEGQQVARREDALTIVAARTAVARVLVRFVVRPPQFELVRTGDKSSAAAPAPGTHADSAVLEQVGAPEKLRSLVSIDLEPDLTRPPRGLYQRGLYQIEQPVTAFGATVRAEVREAPSGWQHNGNAVKVGSIFLFDAGRYVMRGWIEGVTITAANTDGTP